MTAGRITRQKMPSSLAAVDAGGVDVVARHHLDRLPHQEHAEHADQVRRQDAQVGVEQPEPAHPEVQRHDDRLERDHQDADDGEEEDVPAREPELGEAVAGQRRDDHAATRRTTEATRALFSRKRRKGSRANTST